MMTHVTQAPGICHYACLESVLISKGIVTIDQHRLADIGGTERSLLEAVQYLNGNPLTKLLITQTNVTFGGEVDTGQLLSRMKRGQALVVIIYRRESKRLLGHIGETHAIRIEAAAGGVIVMDPFVDKFSPNGAFDVSGRRETDRLIVSTRSVIDDMRRSHEGADFPESFYVY